MLEFKRVAHEGQVYVAVRIEGKTTVWEPATQHTTRARIQNEAGEVQVMGEVTSLPFENRRAVPLGTMPSAITAHRQARERLRDVVLAIAFGGVS